MHLLGIDVGTGGTRALVMDATGVVVASETGDHQPFTSPQIGWAEQAPEDWWRACGVAVRKVLAKSQLPAGRSGVSDCLDKCMGRFCWMNRPASYGLH